MPKATAVWLIENTAMTFDQIADFCELHALEVQAIADEEVDVGIVGIDPVGNGQLTREEISRCEQDPTTRLEMAIAKTLRPTPKTKGPRYTPIAKRQERPDTIAWLLRHYPELSDAQISRIVGTTKTTINAVRDRTHWKGANITPVDPVDIDICSYEELLAEVQLARKRKARADERAAKEVAKIERAAAKTDFVAPLEHAGAVNPYQEHLPMERPGPQLPSVPETNIHDIVPDMVKEAPAASEDENTGTGETPAAQPSAGVDGENEENSDEKARPA